MDRLGRTRVIKSRPKPNGSYVDPHSPTSPDYTIRNRQTSYEIAPGIVRTDIG